MEQPTIEKVNAQIRSYCIDNQRSISFDKLIEAIRASSEDQSMAGPSPKIETKSHPLPSDEETTQQPLLGK